MKRKIIKNLIHVAIVTFFTSAVLVFSVFASSTDGTIDLTYKYAWSENIGWINFGAANGNVHITDSAFSGLALSETAGWINLDNAVNDGEGNLSGYGWGENIGWVNFNPTNGGVAINSLGEFTGSALGENTGWIVFDCDTSACVKTDWRPQGSRFQCNNSLDDDSDGLTDYPDDPGCSSLTDDDEIDPAPSVGGGGGLPPEAYNSPAPPSGGFSILMNNGDEYVNNRIIELKLDGGQDAEKMAISNFADFQNASQEDYQTVKEWELQEGEGAKTVYIKFYTKYGQPSQAVSDTIILDITAPVIKITEIKDYYSSNKDVILSGETEAGAEIILSWDGKYGSTNADSQEKWTVNLSKMPAGDYNLKLQATDLAGNIGDFLTADLIIKQVEISITEIEHRRSPAAREQRGTAAGQEPAITHTEEPSELKTIFEKAKEIIKKIPEVLKPKQEKEEEKTAVLEQTPEAMQGKYDLLSETAIKKFVLSPLPQSLELLIEKFPQLSDVFEKLGVSKASDIQKLKDLQFTLPGLTEAVGLGKKSMAVSEFSKQEKEKIPEEIVFTATARELINFNIDLTIDEQGRAEQKISIVAGKPLNLAIKPISAAKAVRGYLALENLEVGIQNLEHKDQNKISAISNKLKDFIFTKPAFAEEQTEMDKVEEKLVLIEFKYTDPDKDGIWTAEIQAPSVGGEYELITIIEYEDSDLGIRAIKLITVIDPEGYIYRMDGSEETRIRGAVISIYWLNPEIKQYQLWHAKEYRQKNPQTTGATGRYSFLVPEGNYYIKVEAKGYAVYQGEIFKVKEGSGIHINIELKSKNWLLKALDWRTGLLIIFFILLIYNFYKDRKRKK